MINPPSPSPATAALIVAAGRGRRMGEPLPKQFLDLCGRTVLARTVEAFLSTGAIGTIMVVIHPDDAELYETATAGIDDKRLTSPVWGGPTRAASVRLGLEALAAVRPQRVLIHDAARPFVTSALIAEVDAALTEADGAFAAIPVVDAIWSSKGGCADQPVPRDGLWRAQTPQGFHFDKILAAHQSCDFEAADDVAVARAAGLSVRIVEGQDNNFKITTPADFARAENLIRNPQI